MTPHARSRMNSSCRPSAAPRGPCRGRTLQRAGVYSILTGPGFGNSGRALWSPHAQLLDSSAHAAGGALVVVRARQKHRKREAHGLQALQKGMREVAADARRRLDR